MATETTQATEATKQHRPIVISGPSGSGKSTILKRLFDEFPGRFGFSVSHTTRPPRPGEQDGREYHFTTPTHFASLLSAHAFIEHAQFGGNSYGTSISTLNAIASTGRTPILDIEMEGVKQISRHPEFSGTARFLFLSPPDLEVLEERLRGRGTDGEEAVGRRLRQARVEIEFARGEGEGVFERVVVNDVLERAYGEVREWVLEG